MYNTYTEEELRSLCRSSIESFELWARRLIDEKLTIKYGPDYINYKTSEENFLFKKDFRERIQRKLTKGPVRFPRIVDALFMDDMIYLLCREDFYQELFAEALMQAYPNGQKEAHVFLDRIKQIRNALSHANAISIHQAEQVICYTHDFIESVKEYYVKKGMEQVWNVPRIIKITDSLGNTFYNPDNNSQRSIFKLKQSIYCGESYSVTIETDTTFSEAEYDIIWSDQGSNQNMFTNKKTYFTTFNESDVSQVHTIQCTIISHKNWHKYKYYDCQICLMFSVLPPISTF